MFYKTINYLNYKKFHFLSLVLNKMNCVSQTLNFLGFIFSVNIFAPGSENI